MKKLIKSKKGIVALLATLTVVAISATGAFAYFTSYGTGLGTATVGSSSPITLSGTPVANLYPGGAAVPVTVTITNPGSGSQHVGTVSGIVFGDGACDSNWFQAADKVANVTLPAGGSTTVTTNVRMLDSGTDQNVCQGKTLNIGWFSN